MLWELHQFKPLASIALVFQGAGTRADSIFQMRKEGQYFFSRQLGQLVDIEKELMKPSLTGRDIDRFSYQTGNYLLFPYMTDGQEVNLIPASEMATSYPKAWSYLNQPENRSQLEGRDKGVFASRQDWYAYGCPQNMHLLDRPKIVLPDVAGQAEFTFDEAGNYIIDTVYAIRLFDDESDLSTLALCSVLNSRLMTFFLQQTGTDLRGGYFRMKTAYLNPVPIPDISFTTSTAERARLQEKAQKLYARYCEKDDLACVTGFVEHELEQGRGDVVHDLLAFLAQEMIDMNKEKQGVTADFWLDLEGAAEPDAFDKLRNQGKQESSLWKAQACRPFVSEKSRSTRRLDESLGWNEEAFKAFVKALVGSVGNLSGLVNVYRKHHPRYKALLARITRTDYLIDRAVYNLYGLTEEEINIVEGISN